MKPWILRHPLHRLRCVRVELWRDEGGFWNATLPEWDGATTFGYGQRDTLRMAGDLLRALIAWSLEEGKPIPMTPSQLRRVAGSLAGMGLWLDAGEEGEPKGPGKREIQWRQWLGQFGEYALEEPAVPDKAKRRESAGR